MGTAQEESSEHDDEWYLARIQEVLRTFDLGPDTLEVNKHYPLKTQLRALEIAREIAMRAAMKQVPSSTH